MTSGRLQTIFTAFFSINIVNGNLQNQKGEDQLEKNIYTKYYLLQMKSIKPIDERNYYFFQGYIITLIYNFTLTYRIY